MNNEQHACLNCGIHDPKLPATHRSLLAKDPACTATGRVSKAALHPMCRFGWTSW